MDMTKTQLKRLAEETIDQTPTYRMVFEPLRDGGIVAVTGEPGSGKTGFVYKIYNTLCKLNFSVYHPADPLPFPGIVNSNGTIGGDSKRKRDVLKGFVRQCSLEHRIRLIESESSFVTFAGSRGANATSLMLLANTVLQVSKNDAGIRTWSVAKSRWLEGLTDKEHPLRINGQDRALARKCNHHVIRFSDL